MVKLLSFSSKAICYAISEHFLCTKLWLPFSRFRNGSAFTDALWGEEKLGLLSDGELEALHGGAVERASFPAILISPLRSSLQGALVTANAEAVIVISPEKGILSESEAGENGVEVFWEEEKGLDCEDAREEDEAAVPVLLEKHVITSESSSKSVESIYADGSSLDNKAEKGLNGTQTNPLFEEETVMAGKDADLEAVTALNLALTARIRELEEERARAQGALADQGSRVSTPGRSAELEALRDELQKLHAKVAESEALADEVESAQRAMEEALQTECHLESHREFEALQAEVVLLRGEVARAREGRVSDGVLEVKPQFADVEVQSEICTGDGMQEVGTGSQGAQKLGSGQDLEEKVRELERALEDARKENGRLATWQGSAEAGEDVGLEALEDELASLRGTVSENEDLKKRLQMLERKVEEGIQRGVGQNKAPEGRWERGSGAADGAETDADELGVLKQELAAAQVEIERLREEAAAFGAESRALAEGSEALSRGAGVSTAEGVALSALELADNQGDSKTSIYVPPSCEKVIVQSMGSTALSLVESFAFCQENRRNESRS
jgi:hypothetical protein